MKPKPILESTLEKQVVQFCKKHQILTYKFTSPANRGVPDRILMQGGRVLFLELKQSGKVPTTLQLREHQRIRDSGIACHVVDSISQSLFIITLFFDL